MRPSSFNVHKSCFKEEKNHPCGSFAREGRREHESKDASLNLWNVKKRAGETILEGNSQSLCLVEAMKLVPNLAEKELAG